VTGTVGIVLIVIGLLVVMAAMFPIAFAAHGTGLIRPHGTVDLGQLAVIRDSDRQWRNAI